MNRRTVPSASSPTAVTHRAAPARTARRARLGWFFDVAGISLFALVVVLAGILPPARAEETAGESRRVVIPFDFESKFDEGRYGRMIGEMLWKKLDREGGFIIPESMLDVRDWSERRRLVPNPETPLKTMRRIVRDDFGAHVGIWGKVERLPDVDFDQYDLWIKVVDFSQAEPAVVYEVKARTKTVSEIPHVYVKAALDRLYERPDSASEPAANPLAERLWATNPNLVRGDFERLDKSAPAGWDPLPDHVRRVAVREDSAAVNHVIRFQFPQDVAASTGVLYYSDFFPVREGATYRFQCRWRSTGSAVKVFIKCYDELPTSYQGPDRPDAKATAAMPRQRREVYRSQQNLQGAPRVWHTHREDFTPRHTQYTPRWGRVMLYAYWPAGAVDWDDVIVKQIIPSPGNAPGDAPAKTRRPSLETKVLSEELERTRDEKSPP